MTAQSGEPDDHRQNRTPALAWASAPQHRDEASPNPPRPLSGLAVIGWGLVCTAVWLVIVFAGSVIRSGVEGDTGEAETGLLISVVAQLLAGLIGWFLVPRLILARRRLAAQLRFRRPTGRDLAWTATGLGALYLTLFLYRVIVNALGQDQLVPESTISNDGFYEYTSVMIALGVLVILAAPIYEETFARGFVLGGLRPSWGAIPAFLISASVFSALHADLGSLIPFAIAGVILGVLYMRTDSLTAPVLAHAAFNVIGFTATLMQRLG